MPTLTHTSRRMLLAGACASLLAGGVLLAQSGGGVEAARSVITGVTLDSARGVVPSTAIGGTEPSVSGDGRLVAFTGRPLDDADGRTSTVYLRDRSAGSVRELTVPGEGMRAGDSRHPVLSSDGCSVTLVTEIAFDLFRDDDTLERWDVYRAALPECGGDGRFELLSTDASGDALNRVDATSRPAVSTTGSVVAFVAPADPWDPAPWPRAITLVDLTIAAGDAGRIRQVPGLPAERPTAGAEYRGQVEPAVSGTGRYVAFTSDATADQASPQWVEPTDGSPRTQVYVWDRELGGIALVSGLAGVEPGGVAASPSISERGNVIAFTTTSTTLVAAQYPGCSAVLCDVTQVVAAVYPMDLAGNTGNPVLRLVSAPTPASPDAPLVAGDAPSGQPAVSADGHAVAFVSRARNLTLVATTFAGDASSGDLLLSDLGTGSLHRLSLRPDGATPAVAAHRAPSLSATGRVVSFETLASVDLVPGTPADGQAQVVSATVPMDLRMATLDVGSVPVNWPSTEWFVKVTNKSLASFVPATVTSSDPAFYLSGGTCQTGAVVLPGESCTVNIVFIPVAEGPAASTITVAEQGFGAVSVSTLVVGAGGEPLLSASPAGIELPDTEVGSSTEPAQVVVSNVGFFEAPISTVTVGGLHPADFSVVQDDCTGRRLAQGGTCSLSVVFRPLSDGLRTALVTISTASGSRTSAVVSGEGRFRGLLVAAPSARVGQAFSVNGAGFGPERPVLLSWQDGSGRTLTVLTAADGTFTARMVLSPNERTGPRVLVATDPAGGVAPATATVLVLPDDHTSPALPLFPDRLGG